MSIFFCMLLLLQKHSKIEDQEIVIEKSMYSDSLFQISNENNDFSVEGSVYTAALFLILIALFQVIARRRQIRRLRD